MLDSFRPPNEMFQEALLAVFQLHGQVLQAADAMSVDVGLTGARWQVLTVIARQPMTVSQIARRLSLRRQSVQRTVDDLHFQNLVKLEENPDDRRAPLVLLTPQSEQVLEVLRRRREEWVGSCLEGIEPPRLAALVTSLHDLTDRVRQGTTTTIGRSADSEPNVARPTAPGRRLMVD
jgi:DNA-binding MarR family transcriptional regulator